MKEEDFKSLETFKTAVTAWATRWSEKRKPQMKIIKTEEEHRFCFKLYSSTHSFTISAYGPETKGDGYLGCIAWTRKNRAGEDHGRGNDLHDGKFSLETWNKILSDIVTYEIEDIVEPTEYKADKKEEVKSD